MCTIDLLLNLNIKLKVGRNKIMEENLKVDLVYDSIIVGFGPAALNAALYLKRKGLEIGIIGRQRGGQVADTSSVENYLGYKDIMGAGLVDEFYNHVESLNIPKIEYYGVTKITKEDGLFILDCEDGKSYKAKTVVYATGSTSRKLGVPGEEKLFGRGVTYCATCDGPLYRGKTVAVAGGGNSAVEAAIDLSKICKKVYLIHRSTFRADKILLDALNKIDNVEIHLATQIKEVGGQMGLDYIKALDKESGEEKNFNVDGLFVEIGFTPNSQLVKDLADLNEKGEVIVDENCMTKTPGLFAAGDVTFEKHKQIIVAASMGAKAALSLNEYITRL